MAVITTMILLLLWPQIASAANIMTWDNDYWRDRSATDNIFPIYDATPIHKSLGDALGVNLDSYSTPIVYNNILYMFAWESNNYFVGHLIAVDISRSNPSSPNDLPVLWNLAITLAGDGSQGTATGVPGPSISPNGQYEYDGQYVTFKYHDKKDGQEKREKLTVEEFIARLIVHIPDDQFKTIRHYGVYSRRIKAQCKCEGSACF